LADSKQLSRKVRATLESQILAKCDVGIGIATPEEIDQINILQASLLAMHRAVEQLGSEPDHILVDGNRLPDWNYSSEAIVRGDALHPCISAASIVAKESRDRMMRQAAKLHPHYAWESNMGYPTPAHISALRKHGATPLHRRTFGPVAQTILDF
jgi:ribonuclease HII